MIKLLNCDCMEFMATCKDKEFDLAIVDVPYGIGEDGLSNHSRGKCAKATKYTPKNWDKNPPEKEYFKELIRISKNQIVFGANHFISKIAIDSPCWIVWDKDNTGDFADAELAYTSFKSAVRIIKYRWNGMLQQDMKNKEIRIHPTQKPIQLYKWLLTNYAKEGDTIFDSHMGSGSSAIACHQLGYDFVGTEIDQEYFDKAKQRIELHQSQLQIDFTAS